jgi:hypothetical protein
MVKNIILAQYVLELQEDLLQCNYLGGLISLVQKKQKVKRKLQKVSQSINLLYKNKDKMVFYQYFHLYLKGCLNHLCVYKQGALMLHQQLQKVKDSED